ncbi:MAG: cyclic pyranopterin monophosphate synthase MoaC, partial [Deltaproteobacteria bacterium]|nr:cyclic pyranopterin monophosphate synthase MoaC [Deltaproteobacteria bacterium]
MNSFTHLDEQGQMHMVDVGDKPETLRRATAACRIVVGPKVYPLLLAGQLPKGDVWAAARLAGIMAAKNTSQLIPLCHPLPLSGVEVEFIPEPEEWAVAIRVKVKTRARTGVEMEALTAAAVAALTIYDMCKAVDRGLRITGLMLMEKSGGASGEYHRDAAAPENILR